MAGRTRKSSRLSVAELEAKHCVEIIHSSPSRSAGVIVLVGEHLVEQRQAPEVCSRSSDTALVQPPAIDHGRLRPTAPSARVCRASTTITSRFNRVLAAARFSQVNSISLAIMCL